MCHIHRNTMGVREVISPRETKEKEKKSEREREGEGERGREREGEGEGERGGREREVARTHRRHSK